MKLVLAAVALAGLGSVAAVVYVGARLREPTVVADPYQAGLHYDEARHAHQAGGPGPAAPGGREGRPAAACELSRGPCVRQVDGVSVRLDVDPRPVRAMREATFTVEALRAGIPVSDAVVELSLAMPGMYMGENRVRLAELGAGRYRGRATVVRCPSGKRTWSAEVSIAAREPRAAAPLQASFTFEAAD